MITTPNKNKLPTPSTKTVEDFEFHAAIVVRLKMSQILMSKRSKHDAAITFAAIAATAMGEYYSLPEPTLRTGEDIINEVAEAIANVIKAHLK